MNVVRQQLGSCVLDELVFNRPVMANNVCLKKQNLDDYSFLELKTFLNTITIRSSFSFVVPVIEVILDDMRKTAICQDEKMIDLFLILSELIINAIEHGNKLDISKNVNIEYLIKSNKICVSVEDEGEGEGYFYKDLINSEITKGLGFIKYIASNVCWNAAGNKVFICLNF